MWSRLFYCPESEALYTPGASCKPCLNGGSTLNPKPQIFSAETATWILQLPLWSYRGEDAAKQVSKPSTSNRKAQYVGYDGSKVLSGCKGLYRAFKLTAYNVRAGVLGVYCCISIRELPKIGDPYI